MKLYILAAPLLALTACGSTPENANNVVDVASNNMIADDVTEVQDDSASAPPSDTGAAAPVETPMTDSEVENEARNKKDRGEE